MSLLVCPYLKSYHQFQCVELLVASAVRRTLCLKVCAVLPSAFFSASGRAMPLLERADTAAGRHLRTPFFHFQNQGQVCGACIILPDLHSDILSSARSLLLTTNHLQFGHDMPSDLGALHPLHAFRLPICRLIQSHRMLDLDEWDWGPWKFVLSSACPSVAPLVLKETVSLSAGQSTGTGSEGGSRQPPPWQHFFRNRDEAAQEGSRGQGGKRS